MNPLLLNSIPSGNEVKLLKETSSNVSIKLFISSILFPDKIRTLSFSDFISYLTFFCTFFGNSEIFFLTSSSPVKNSVSICKKEEFNALAKELIIGKITFAGILLALATAALTRE